MPRRILRDGINGTRRKGYKPFKSTISNRVSEDTLRKLQELREPVRKPAKTRPHEAV